MYEKDYANPYICVNYPDHKILHVEMKHLITEKSAPLCSKSIVDLAKNLTSGEKKVIVSAIIPRNDESNNKAAEVNEYVQNVQRI